MNFISWEVTWSLNLRNIGGEKNQIKHFWAEPQRQGFGSLKYLQVNPMEKSKMKTSSDFKEFVSDFDKVQVF